MSTHEVLDQPPPLGDVDLYAHDPILGLLLGELDASWAEGRLAEFG
ncbi:MAG TPA: hypothetical protein VIW46_05550 [Acidimicrobiia bacterium]|jgi:hypothetical protein